MAHVFALTSDSGIPIFSRSLGNAAESPLNFAEIGTLNGVHLFCALRGAQLHRSETFNGTAVHWKVYYGAITLTLVLLSDCRPDFVSEELVRQLLDSIFQVLTFHAGLSSLKNISISIERVKRDIKPGLAIIDALVSSLIGEREQGEPLSETFRPPCILPATIPYHPLLAGPAIQNVSVYLEAYTTRIDASYGFVVFEDFLLLGTKSFNALPTGDQSILVLQAAFVEMAANKRAFEGGIFLPDSSPDSCNRLVVVCVGGNFRVCVLALPETNIAILEEHALGLAAFPPHVLEANTTAWLRESRRTILENLHHSVAALSFVGRKRHHLRWFVDPQLKVMLQLQECVKFNFGTEETDGFCRFGELPNSYVACHRVHDGQKLFVVLSNVPLFAISTLVDKIFKYISSKCS